MRVPVKIIVNRVIDPAAVFRPKTNIQRRHAVVLQKRREIRAGSQRVYASVCPLPNLPPLFRRFRIGDFLQVIALPRRELGFRISDVPRHVIAEFFQRVRTLDPQIATGISVGVYIRHRVRPQFVVVRFRPLRRAQQAPALRRPTRNK